MRPDAFIVLLELIIMTCVSILLVHQFMIVRNGKLRRLMIFFWAAQGWATLWSGFHFWFIMNYHWSIIDAIVSRLIALTPVAVSMIFILVWVIKQNRKP